MPERGTLLVELGTEELPPKALIELERAFRDGIAQGLRDAGLEPGRVHGFATPRRLAVLIDEVTLRQPDRTVEDQHPGLLGFGRRHEHVFIRAAAGRRLVQVARAFSIGREHDSAPVSRPRRATVNPRIVGESTKHSSRGVEYPDVSILVDLPAQGELAAIR